MKVPVSEMRTVRYDTTITGLGLLMKHPVVIQGTGDGPTETEILRLCE
jgi:hypothetical protein